MQQNTRKIRSSGKDMEKSSERTGISEKTSIDGDVNKKQDTANGKRARHFPHGFNYEGPPGPIHSHGTSETWKNTTPRVPAT